MRRRGLGWLRSRSLYHAALNATWPQFLRSCAATYLLLNVVFAAAFWACGPDAVTGADVRSIGGTLWRDFFFSVETTAAIRFSRTMVVAPYRGGRGLMFRIVNRRSNQLIDLRARVNCSWIDRSGGTALRRYELLALERSDVMFFPLSWTIVHPLTPESPIHGLTDEELRSGDYEFLVIISGTGDTFSQQVHTRTSYKPEEIVWGAKFRNIFNPPDDDGMISVDVHRIDEYDRVPLPA